MLSGQRGPWSQPVTSAILTHIDETTVSSSIFKGQLTSCLGLFFSNCSKKKKLSQPVISQRQFPKQPYLQGCCLSIYFTWYHIFRILKAVKIILSKVCFIGRGIESSTDQESYDQDDLIAKTHLLTPFLQAESLSSEFSHSLALEPEARVLISQGLNFFIWINYSLRSFPDVQIY